MKTNAAGTSASQLACAMAGSSKRSDWKYCSHATAVNRFISRKAGQSANTTRRVRSRSHSATSRNAAVQVENAISATAKNGADRSASAKNTSRNAESTTKARTKAGPVIAAEDRESLRQATRFPEP